MKVFFGGAIQGHAQRGERSNIYQLILKTISNLGHVTYSEHTLGKTLDEVLSLMENSIGPLPSKSDERVIYVRNKMIEGVEGEIDAAIFEISTPSLGTGIEFAHAYLRPRMGIREIPILGLYQEGFWPNNLSSMIRGINNETVPKFTLKTYTGDAGLVDTITNFLGSIGK